jgi:hypothetical protein
MSVFNWQKKQREDGSESFEIPDELHKQIENGSKAAEELPKIREMLEGLQSFVESSTAAQKKKDDDAAAAAANSHRAETATETEERIEQLMLEGRTKEALALANQPIAAEVLMLRSDRIKRELFEDEKRFKYYTGDVKREVDSLINGQSLQMRNDPSVIENCYLTVVGKHNDEIVEGKLKNRFAGAEGNRGTSGGSAGETGAGESKPTQLSGEALRAAKQLGFKPEEYAKMLDEEGIGWS